MSAGRRIPGAVGARVAVLLAITVVILVATRGGEDPPGPVETEVGSAPARPSSPAGGDAPPAGALDASLGDPGDAPAGLAVEAEPPLANAASSSALELEHVRAALEDTLHGFIDPNVFLELALALAGLEVGDEALEPGPPSAERYPIAGTPGGITAELRIAHPSNQAFGSVRSLVIHCEPPSDQYVIEGAVRSNMRAEVTVWTDRDGRVKNFGVFTDFEISDKTYELHMPVDHVPTGLLYAYDAAKPLEEVAYLMGFSGGHRQSWKDDPVVIGGSALPAEGLELLSAGLLRMHASGDR